jgi:hypothetical protein
MHKESYKNLLFLNMLTIFPFQTARYLALTVGVVFGYRKKSEYCVACLISVKTLWFIYIWSFYCHRISVHLLIIDVGMPRYMIKFSVTNLLNIKCILACDQFSPSTNSRQHYIFTWNSRYFYMYSSCLIKSSLQNLQSQF